MQKKDISFSLSGGPHNTNPNHSLGGLSSNSHIGDNLDNLFDDVTAAHANAGYIDYRCFYIVNNNQEEKLKDFSVYAHKNLSGSEISIGLALQSEVQALMIAGNPPNGHFQMQYVLQQGNTSITDHTSLITWTPDANTMAQRIAALLNSMDHLQGVQCLGQQTSAGYDFLITFAGSASGRSQQILRVVHAVGIEGNVVRVTQGGPINSIAPNIGMPNNAPNGVTFYQTDNLTPIQVGSLFPNDFVPIWIKREVMNGTIPVHPDQFRFYIAGEAMAGNIAVKKHTPDTKVPTTTTKSSHMLF